VSASYNKLSSTLAASGFKTKRLLTPRGAWSFRHTVTATISTTVRVINSIHNYATDRWSDTFVARAAGFSNFDVLVLLVTNDAHAGAAIFID
jgi:cytochrome bd-type quinol oxidase subunit 1